MESEFVFESTEETTTQSVRPARSSSTCRSSAGDGNHHHACLQPEAAAVSQKLLLPERLSLLALEKAIGSGHHQSFFIELSVGVVQMSRALVLPPPRAHSPMTLRLRDHSPVEHWQLYVTKQCLNRMAHERAASTRCLRDAYEKPVLQESTRDALCGV